jgi:hypothetical protein
MRSCCNKKIEIDTIYINNVCTEFNYASNRVKIILLLLSIIVNYLIISDFLFFFSFMLLNQVYSTKKNTNNI